MKKLLVIAVIFIASCSTTRTSRLKDDGRLTVTFVQINDVYEIAPLEGGRVGGVARVATLKEREQKKNQNTLLVIAGDFLSPSVYNSLKYEGERIRGKQMVESLNAAGLDLAVFGNHEFDIKEEELQKRIDESKFEWISSNSFQKTENGIRPFVKHIDPVSHPLPQTVIKNFTDTDGTTARIGFIGLNIPFNKAPYVAYTDVFETADRLYRQIKDSCDAVVAITHLAVEEDSLLAVRIPELALIMGGHEHDMRFLKVGDVFITKAHANAKSAFVNNLTIDKKRGRTGVIPELVLLDTSFALNPQTLEVVNKWGDIARESFAALGFESDDILVAEGEPLEGREEFVRSGATNLTKTVVAAMQEAAPEADVVLLNSGSLRVDDVLRVPITQYDIIRTLPYGGFIQEADMSGALLLQTLEAGRQNVGNGGFLQYSPDVSFDGKQWFLQGRGIDPERIYRVALADFLMSGGEANMEFLTKNNRGVQKVYPLPDDDDVRRDIRLAVIEYLKKQQKEN